MDKDKITEHAEKMKEGRLISIPVWVTPDDDWVLLDGNTRLEARKKD